MSSTRALPMMRLPCCQESSEPYTSSSRRGGDHLGAASSAMTPPTLSPTAPRGRSLTPPTSMMTPTRMTPAKRAITRRSTASETRRRRSSKRSCPERVLPRATLTSPVMTPLAQKRMRRSSTSKTTSSTFASWVNL
jgi:hypothetical protein